MTACYLINRFGLWEACGMFGICRGSLHAYRQVTGWPSSGCCLTQTEQNLSTAFQHRDKVLLMSLAVRRRASYCCSCFQESSSCSLVWCLACADNLHPPCCCQCVCRCLSSCTAAARSSAAIHVRRLHGNSAHRPQQGCRHHVCTVHPSFS